MAVLVLCLLVQEQPGAGQPGRRRASGSRGQDAVRGVAGRGDGHHRRLHCQPGQ